MIVAVGNLMFEQKLKQLNLAINMNGTVKQFENFYLF